MSVRVQYGGRFGNNLFQYVCARLFADRNVMGLDTPFRYQEMVRMVPHGRRPVAPPGPEIRLSDSDEVLGRVWTPGRYVLDGHFQRSDWYHEARGEIEAFAFPEPLAEVNTRDIVANMRLGEDYRRLGWTIDPSWYLDVLSRESFGRLHIVTDNPEDKEYLSNFRKFDPVIVSSGQSGDWWHIRSFDRIVCSNSSFCWWAAFFSRASRIYTFKRWVGEDRTGAPVVRLGRFPNGIEVDGRLMGER